jgi:hypothetical protein
MENKMFADGGFPLLRMDMTFVGGQSVCPVLDERGFITADRARALVRAANGVMIDVCSGGETGPTYLTDAGTGSSALFPGAAAAHKTQARLRTYSRAHSSASPHPLRSNFRAGRSS